MNRWINELKYNTHSIEKHSTQAVSDESKDGWIRKT